MKKYFVVSLLIIYIVSMFAPGAFAAPEVTYIKGNSNLRITGHIDGAYDGEEVTVVAMRGESYVHIGSCKLDRFGNYLYKFGFDGTADDIEITVRQSDGKIFTPDLVLRDSEPVSVKLEMLNSKGNTFHINDVADTEKKVILRGSAENYYGNAGKYQLLIASYSDNNILISVDKNEVQLEYSADGQLSVQDIEYTVPADTKCIKGFAFDSMENIKPLTENKTQTASSAHGLCNVSEGKGELKIAYLGGSITEGASILEPKTNRWSTLITDKFSEKFPEKTVTQINAGIGGTGSNMGNVRLEKDIISYEPDVVFVEYAVNDAYAGELTGTERLADYEDIITRLLNLPKQPIIIMVYFPSYDSSSIPYATSGKYSELILTNAGASQQKLANYYGIGSIDLHTYIKSLIGGAEYPYWLDFADDEVHPTEKGHRTCAEYIWKCLTENWDAYFKNYNNQKERFTADSNTSTPELIAWDSNRLNYTAEGGEWSSNAAISGFKTDSQYYNKGRNTFVSNGASESKGTIKLDFDGNVFGIYGTQWSGAGNGEVVTYDIDNGYRKGTVKTSGGLYTLKTLLMIEDLPDCKHTVTISVKNNTETEQGDALFNFGYIVVDEN